MSLYFVLGNDIIHEKAGQVDRSQCPISHRKEVAARSRCGSPRSAHWPVRRSLGEPQRFGCLGHMASCVHLRACRTSFRGTVAGSRPNRRRQLREEKTRSWCCPPPVGHHPAYGSQRPYLGPLHPLQAHPKGILECCGLLEGKLPLEVQELGLEM